MGQKPSVLGGSKLFSTPSPSRRGEIAWIRRHPPQNHQQQQPIKFQYKSKRKDNKERTVNVVAEHKEDIDRNEKSSFLVTKKENVKADEKRNENVCPKVEQVACRGTKGIAARTKSEPNLCNRGKHRHKRRNSRLKTQVQQFGYEIQDVDDFLDKASIQEPANIPVVLAFPTVLYQTRIGGYQAEIALPLGMMVNAIFKKDHWLYVQTPHAEEGYVNYAACLPLGIIPPPDKEDSPAWEKSTDVFPKPSGNMTDTEKLSSKSDCETDSQCPSTRSCGEHHLDRLYLKATAKYHQNIALRQTLSLICRHSNTVDCSSLSSKRDETLCSNDMRRHRLKKCANDCSVPASFVEHGFL